jgi:hypothetical protein
MPASYAGLIMASSTTRLRGTCHLFLAMEVGLAIDLVQAEAVLRGAGRIRLPLSRNPGGIDWSSAPLRLEQEAPPIDLEGHRVQPVVQVSLYDFGAVSLAYRIPFLADPEGLSQLSGSAAGHPALQADARARVAAILQTIGDAVQRPCMREGIEDYLVFVVQGEPDSESIPAAMGLGEATIAGILRAEPRRLSEQEVRDSVSATVSYGPLDAAIIDWNAALVIDAEPQATLDVLEFANVELLEYRLLDEQLDASLEEAQRTLMRRRSATAGWRSAHRDLERLADLQMDAALLYEEISNALKLLGDQFLARLYRAASRRMHLDEWERSTLRKLETLDSIHDKLAAEQGSRRAEMLEWIIILLISAEIVFSLVSFLRP